MPKIAALIRVSLMTTMQYRSDFFLDMLTSLVRAFGAIAPLLLVYAHRTAVDGWTFPEATLVLALFMLLEALQGGLMEPNLGAVVEGVRKGTLDLVLMKPLDAQLLVSFSRFAPGRVWDLLAALLVGGWAIARMPAPAPLDVVIALGLLGAGIVAMYGLWVLAICASFYWVKVDNLRFLITSAAEAGRWPVTVFTGVFRWALTALVPIAVITTFPAQALRGTWSFGLLGLGFGIGAAFLLGSRWAWNRALAHYTSASS